MLKVGSAIILLMAVCATPASAAPEYPWCQRTGSNGDTPECLFSNRSQCEASVNGIGGSCVVNPVLAFRETTSNAYAKYRGPVTRKKK